jgi:hypothetical protein
MFMGLFRKMTSVSTLGAVDFRSDKERTAKYTKKSMREAKAQTALMKAEQARERDKARAAARPVARSTPSPVPPAASVSGNLAEQIAKLGELRSAGVLSEAEFTAAKARLLA